MDIYNEIIEAKKVMDFAWQNFNNAEKDYVIASIHDINSAVEKFNNLIKRAKTEGILESEIEALKLLNKK